jgi:hypothetical protein
MHCDKVASPGLNWHKACQLKEDPRRNTQCSPYCAGLISPTGVTGVSCTSHQRSDALVRCGLDGAQGCKLRRRASLQQQARLPDPNGKAEL